MIVGLIDFPERNHELVLETLEKQGAFIMKGTFDEMYWRAEKIHKEKPDAIIIWDEPMLIEKGYAQQVDKLLEIVRMGRSLTSEEHRIHLVRSSRPYDRYIMSMPEAQRERTEEAWNTRLLVMKEEVKRYIQQWRAELRGDILKDREIRMIAETMVSASSIKLNSLELHSNAMLPYNARYLDWLNAIILNPYLIRKNHPRQTKLKVILTVAHELGHAFDPQLPIINERKRTLEKAIKTARTKNEVEEIMKEITSLTLQAEKNAYDYAYQFLPDDFPSELLEDERQRNEAAYTLMLQTKKEKYMRSI